MLITTKSNVLALAFAVATASCSTALHPTPETGISATSPTSQPALHEAGDWQVDDINQRGIVDFTNVSIAFTADGKTNGDSGCNPWFGTYSVAGDGITISNIGSGRRACPEAIATQEQRFYAALSAAVRFEIQGDSVLVLYDADNNPRVRAVTEHPGPAGLTAMSVSEFDCQGLGTVAIRSMGRESVEVTIREAKHTLARTASASGEKYIAAGASFWNKGENAMLEANGKIYECTRR